MAKLNLIIANMPNGSALVVWPWDDVNSSGIKTAAASSRLFAWRRLIVGHLPNQILIIIFCDGTPKCLTRVRRDTRDTAQAEGDVGPQQRIDYWLPVCRAGSAPGTNRADTRAQLDPGLKPNQTQDPNQTLKINP